MIREACTPSIRFDDMIITTLDISDGKFSFRFAVGSSFVCFNCFVYIMVILKQWDKTKPFFDLINSSDILPC